MKQLLYVMALFILFIVLGILVTTHVYATSYTATHLGSDASYISFLQYGTDAKRVSFFTNRYDGPSVTHNLDFSGDFSVFVVNTQQRYLLNDPQILQKGNTYYLEDWTDNDYNDFVFTLQSEDMYTAAVRPPTQTPEPGTVVLLATGLIGLGLWRYSRS